LQPPTSTEHACFFDQNPRPIESIASPFFSPLSVERLDTRYATILKADLPPRHFSGN